MNHPDEEMPVPREKLQDLLVSPTADPSDVSKTQTNETNNKSFVAPSEFPSELSNSISETDLKNSSLTVAQEEGINDFTLKLKIYGLLIVRLIISIIAFWLAWECNQMDGFIFRVLVSVVAFLLPEIYIVYYAIYHVFMGVQCYAPIVPQVAQVV